MVKILLALTLLVLIILVYSFIIHLKKKGVYIKAGQKWDNIVKDL